jgi:alpha-tubulin suppressor-like RCC1 family protein
MHPRALALCLTALFAFSACPAPPADDAGDPSTPIGDSGVPAGDGGTPLVDGGAPVDAGVGVLSIEILPIDPQTQVGAFLRLNAIATDVEGGERDVTTDVIWASSANDVVTVGNDEASVGVVTGVSPGRADITASLGGAVGITEVTVVAPGDPVLVAVIIDPPLPSALPTETLQLSATALYSDGSDEVPASGVTWESTDTSVFTVDGSGLLTAVAEGAATVRASYDGVQGTTVVTVGAATLESITVTPDGISLFVGDQQSYIASASYSDGSAVDVTESVTWNSDDPDIVVVSNAAGTEGEATAQGIGSTSITAQLGDVTGSTTLTVDAVPIQSIAITPEDADVALGETIAFTAEGTFGDLSVADVTDMVAWSSDTPGVVSFDGNDATANAMGSATITASLDGVDATTTITVGDKVLSAVEVTPSPGSVPDGRTLQLGATARYSDNSTNDVSASVTWTSLTPAVATVDENGLLTGESEGTATVRASFSGVDGDGDIDVAAPVVDRVRAFNKHGAFLMSNGTVRLFGHNRYGQTGVEPSAATGCTCPAGEATCSVAPCDAPDICDTSLNTTTATAGLCVDIVLEPTELSGIDDAIDVVVGGFQTYVLRSGGRVVGLGRNTLGNYLGSSQGSDVVTTTPIDVETAAGVPLANIVQITAGYSHAMALRNDGGIYAWGSDASGQLGNVPATDDTFARRLGGNLPGLYLAAGAFHSLAVVDVTTLGGTTGVLAFGDNSYGQLGRGTVGGTSGTPEFVRWTQGGSAVGGVLRVEAGWGHSVGLADGTDRAVIVWGWDAFGQLGDGTKGPDTGTPSIALTGDYIEIDSGFVHTLVRDGDGNQWLWGGNLYGQLGDGTQSGPPVNEPANDSVTPSQLTLPAPVRQTVAGGDMSMVVLDDDRVFSWGSGVFGENGLGTQSNALTPTEVVSVAP